MCVFCYLVIAAGMRVFGQTLDGSEASLQHLQRLSSWVGEPALEDGMWDRPLPVTLA
jgi:hypothetical protein